MMLRLAVVVLAVLMSGCAGPPDVDAPALVFRHAKLFGDPGALDRLMGSFEQESGLRVRRETLPASSDEQHLFYAINLRAKSSDFDVLAVDVVWTAEFARAGWLRDLSGGFTEGDRADFFPAALESATWQGRQYAYPWFVDAGVLYFRKDLLTKYGIEPPRTWGDLANTARVVAAREPELYGFVWQGKQYEGLVCNAMEYVWSFGGSLGGGRAEVESAARALGFMRALVTDGVTPAFVTTLTEEPSRILFGKGRAVFLRNWPYAWKLFEREDSMVRGKVGVMSLPSAPGHLPASTLGGWQLGVNAFSKRPREAEQLVAYLARPSSQKALALAYGYSPPRRSLYEDAALLSEQPFVASLRDIFDAARSRPVTPYYMELTQGLQAELSAVVAGVRTPTEALATISPMLERIAVQ